MKNYHCPGQSKRNLQAELQQCSACGYQVEIFSDELMVRCPGCAKERFSQDWLQKLFHLVAQCVGCFGKQMILLQKNC